MRPVAISLSPNTEKDDVLLALKTLIQPWKWFDRSLVDEFERKFEKIFGGKFKAISVNSGRSAEYLILKSLGIGSGDVVAIQAFTCVAVPNPIIWNGAKPIYIDIDETFNMDASDLAKKMTSKVKCIIVQHTFGVPADMDNIKKIAKKYNVPVIEDCAVSLGAEYKGRKVGTLSDIAFFSFGRDKVISSVFGGAMLTSNPKYFESLKKLRDELSNPSISWVLKQLMHPILFSVILPLYNFGLGKFGIGKMILLLTQKLRILDKAVYEEEKMGRRPNNFPSKFVGALAILASYQLDKISRYNEIRKRIYKTYFKFLKRSELKFPQNNPGAIWLRVPVLSSYAQEIIDFAKRKRILLGDWYKKPVVPVRDMDTIGYIYGSCPISEKYSSEIFNLPTYPTMSETDVQNVVRTINLWENLHRKK